jgi:hypothetical protein
MMKIVLLLLIFIQTAQGGEWFEEIIREDEDHYYFVGMSSYHANEKGALEEAYQEAIKEAIRYNYGVVHHYRSTVSSSTTSVNNQDQALMYREGVQIRGVIPKRSRVVEKNDLYMAYREIQYPKNEINKEKFRLKNVKQKKYTLDSPELPKKKKQKDTEPEVIELSKYAFIYYPFSSRNGNTEFLTLPFKYEQYIYKYLSLGIGYMQDEDTWETEVDGYIMERTHRTYEMSLEMKLYLYRTPRYAFAVGIEQMSLLQTSFLGDEYLEIDKEKTSEELQGYSLTFKKAMSVNTNKSAGVSWFLEHRTHKGYETTSFGFSFEF